MVDPNERDDPGALGQLRQSNRLRNDGLPERRAAVRAMDDLSDIVGGMMRIE